MALLNADKQKAALKAYADWFEVNATTAQRQVQANTNRAAITLAITQLDAALELAMPTIRAGATEPTLTPAIKNRLLRVIVEQAING